MDIANKGNKRDSASFSLSDPIISNDESDEHLLNIQTQIRHLHQKRGTLTTFQRSALNDNTLIEYWYVLEFVLLIPSKS
jgi:hypothetical protein